MRKVSGITSASRSMARICMARIGIAQSPMATAARPSITTMSSAMLVVRDARTVFFRLL